MIASTPEAGPVQASPPPDAELFQVCQAMVVTAGMWRTLRDAMNAEGPFGGAYTAFRAFEESVWPGFSSGERYDLVTWLARLTPATPEGRQARARAALDLHDAMQAECTGHINQAAIIRAVLVEAAGSDPGAPVALPEDDAS